MLKKSKILLGLTTTTGSDWNKKLSDIDRLDLKEMSLFLTGVNYTERSYIYDKLESTSLKNIPHVHLRSDMTEDEIEYLLKKFNVKYFNIHSNNTKYPFDRKIIDKFKDQIYIENNDVLTNNNIDEINSIAGLCLDVSHFENYCLYNGKDNDFHEFENMLNSNKIGCSHISSIRENSPKVKEDGKISYSYHVFNNLSDFDYLKKYEKYFSEFLSLELENDFNEQIKARGYIENLF